MPDAHALLSPSSASRWMHCTPSARLAEGLPEAAPRDFALEGTLAHAMCARTLKRPLGLPVDEENAEIARLHARYYNAGMPADVMTYVRYVRARLNRAPGGRLLVEQRLDFSRWIPESFGTSDAIILHRGTLHVVDFKYGRGVRVDAEGNAQMRIYALGALAAYGAALDIHTVRMAIVQPRLAHFSEATERAADLLHWADTELRTAALSAWRGRGPRRGGPWCRFCRLRPDCPECAASSGLRPAAADDFRGITL